MIAATVCWREDGAPSRYDAPRERVPHTQWLGVRHSKVPMHAYSGHAGLLPHCIRELCCGAPSGWLAFDRVHLFMLLSVNLNMERRKTSWASNLQTV